MKYMGSKARLAKHILPIILKERVQGQPYVEPFVGGFNMICNVPEEQGPRYANDINEFLIEMFKLTSQGVEPPKNITKEEYLKAKNGEYSKALTGYIGFNCSYSGKWFGGYAGIVKTKAGVRNYQEEAWRNVVEQSKKLKNLFFCSKPYFELQIPSNSIIYCDPPYEGTTSYKDKFDSDLFWNWAREKTKEGHKVFISEYNAPGDFECLWSKEFSSSLSANGKIGSNKISVEKLFRFKP